MPSNPHEALIQMFRHRPTLAPELLTASFGVDVPSYDRIQLGSGELTPIEHRADAVVELRSGDTVALAVIVEVQLGYDHRKRFSWPVYLTTVRSRLRCPTVVLVICTNGRTARWCATPVQLGPGNTFAANVLGPQQVPVLTDPNLATANPELAVLSALAHGGDPDHSDVLKVLPPALVTVDDQHSKLYYDLVLKALPNAARRYLEELMTTAYEYQSDFARKYVAEGQATGVLTILSLRGIDVPANALLRITTCTDLDQLTTWLQRAATADTLDDVFRATDEQ